MLFLRVASYHYTTINTETFFELLRPLWLYMRYSGIRDYCGLLCCAFNEGYTCTLKVSLGGFWGV